MATGYDYKRLRDTLTYSRDHFDEVDNLLSSLAANGNATEIDEARRRWQHVLNGGTDLAGWVYEHIRAQSPAVYDALGELTKYADVRRPFRLSVIGQKGVGKSALVNALLGAPNNTQYTPSDVTGKALSGTRIRLLAQTDAGQPVWKIQFLTPRRLWEVGTFLLQVAGIKVPNAPAELDSRNAVASLLEKTLSKAGAGSTAATPSQIQADAARATLSRMLKVYREQEILIPASYLIQLDDPDVEGPVSAYLRQTPEDLHLIVDYVERRLPPQDSAFLAGRPLELEDVLGLDDPRDSFFALEAFKEAFAVVLVFKCDRGLNTETLSILKSLFQRDEDELAQFGNISDLNKAIIVANRFDEILSNVSAEKTGNPLQGIDDIRKELAKFTRQWQHVPIYLTSASVAQTARHLLNMQERGTEAEVLRPATTPSYNWYVDGLSNLLQVVADKANRTGQLPPDYLDFIVNRRTEIDEMATKPKLSAAYAQLTLELSGLPRLVDKVQEALESGSILRGRVANAEYYLTRTVAETAQCYARLMNTQKLALSEFTHPPLNRESQLFTRFQHEVRQTLQALDEEFHTQWFELAQRYIYGPHSAETEATRETYLETVSRVIHNNRQLIQNERHISSGQIVTDSWRKVFEDINDWLALQAGREMRRLVTPLINDIERLLSQFQKTVSERSPMPVQEQFWGDYRARMDTLRTRLQNFAEVLALGYYTDHRFSVYDERIAQILHVGEAAKRRDDISHALRERVLEWFNNMWQLMAKVAMTELNSFVGEIRYYVLGLPAERSVLVGLELNEPGRSQLPPASSLIAHLDNRYHGDENFRRQYAMREPSPLERLANEIRGWLGLIKAPHDGISELSKALSLVAATTAREQEAEASDVPPERSGTANPLTKAAGLLRRFVDNVPSAPRAPEPVNVPGGAMFTRFRSPIETAHPYPRVSRQVWEVENPDKNATSTRLHFSRIDLGTTNPNFASIVIEGYSNGKRQVITGQQADFWTETFPGRVVKVRFISDNPQPAWGFALDGVTSGSPEAAKI
jgi:virulence-associated protein VapD